MMLNKEEILKKISKIDKKIKDFVVLSDASMVVQGIKEKTNTIDIAILKNTEKYIQDYSYIINNAGEKIYYKDNINFFIEYCDCKYEIIDGIKYATLESILEFKKKSNLKKDDKDIKTLDLVICLKDNRRYEKQLYKEGLSLIAGVDEVGRGPLVGPVVAAAVILPTDFYLKGLTDSKKLSEKKRNEFDIYIKNNCISYGIGVIDNKIIDEVNILEATKLAMKKAIDNLKVKPEHILVDAMKMNFGIPSTAIIKGDIKSISISAASVIAKVYRDNLMYDLDKKYPYYNYKSNKGYPTKEHLKAIKQYGITDDYRRSFGPVKEVI